MKKQIKNQIRKSPELYGRLRDSKYLLWQFPVVDKLVAVPPEITQIERMVVTRHETQVAETGKKILVFIPRSWSLHVAQDLIVAYSLRLRGADVNIYTCGDRMPICQIASHHSAPPMPCNFCKTYSDRMLTAFGFKANRWREYVSADEVDEIKRNVERLSPDQLATYEDRDVAIGQLVRVSVLWFMNSGQMEGDSLLLENYRKFLVSGTIVARAAAQLLAQKRPDTIYMLNGMFFEERILMEMAHKQGVEVITHEGGFHADSKVFARNGIAGHYRSDQIWQSLLEKSLANDEVLQLDGYLQARRQGGKDVGRIYPKLEADKEKIMVQLQLDQARPLLVAFTNILWDSAVLGRHTIFSGMEAWLFKTIEYAEQHPNAQLIIRIHPAEVRIELRETRQKVKDVIDARYPQLPPNVRIIEPESSVSSYVLMQLCDLGLVYTSTTGLEMALQGIPVVVSGETHYMNKGFTHQPQSHDHYNQLLDQVGELTLPQSDSLELARRYAHLFFFKKMIPFPLTTQLERGKVLFNFDDFSALEPGKNASLDLICDGILHCRPFLQGDDLPDEFLEAYAKS